MSQTTGAAYPGLARLAGLRRGDELATALAGMTASPAVVAATLRSHHLSMLTLNALGPARTHVSRDMVSALEAVRPEQLATVDELTAGFVDVRSRLEAAGIPVILLKGFSLAERLYGDVHLRPQFDLDILVRSRQLKAAVRHLAAAGFARTAYDLHSRTMSRGHVKVDVHGCLRWAPAYRLDEEAMWTTSRTMTVSGQPARVLSDEYALLGLLLGAFEDLGQGMAKLKQMLDIYLLTRELDPAFDWHAFFAQRESENLTRVVTSVLALIVALFEAEVEAPRLVAALARRDQPVGADRQRLALSLVFAPRKDQANLMWFRQVYPGSLPHYLVWFWSGGFPANAMSGGPGAVVRALRALTRSTVAW